MKVAISHWQGRVSPVFDVSDKIVLIDLEDKKELGRRNILLTDRDPFRRAREVSNLGTDVLLCGAISRALETALIGAGIEVVGFLCGNTEAILAAFLREQLSLSRYQMPGSRNGRPKRGFFAPAEGLKIVATPTTDEEGGK